MFKEKINNPEAKIINEVIDIPLEKENAFEILKKSLVKTFGEEGTDQLIFVLKTEVEKDFVNQCNKATQELGADLLKNFGEEESFFELVPNSKYYDARSEEPLTKLSYRGDFHSVGLIEVDLGEKGRMSLAIDLNFSDLGVSRENVIRILSSSGNKEDMLNFLKKEYGGKWKLNYYLDKEKGNYIFCEK